MAYSKQNMIAHYARIGNEFSPVAYSKQNLIAHYARTGNESLFLVSGLFPDEHWCLKKKYPSSFISHL